MKSIKNPIQRIRNILLTHQKPIYLLLIILLGALLRFYDLGVESFWIDEIYTVHLTSQDLPTLVQNLLMKSDDTPHAVYYLLVHFWVLPSGISEFSIRSLSVVIGVLSIGMMYLVGKQLFDADVGLISAFLMAISEFHIQYSQEARAYSLLVLLTLFSIYYYIRMYKTEKPWLWIVIVLFNGLLFYTHTSTIFVFAAEYLHYFLYWKRHKNTFIQWGVAQLVFLLFVIPSVFGIVGSEESVSNFTGTLAWIAAPSLKVFISTVYSYIFPQNYQHSWLFIALSFLVASVVFIIGVLLFNSKKARDHWSIVIKDLFRNLLITTKIDSDYMLVVLWFLCPTLLLFIFSKIFTPLFIDRYTIGAVPAFFLLVAAAISRIRNRAPIYLSLLTLLIVVIPGLQDYYVSDVKEQWREAAAYVQENYRPDDIIVYAPDEKGIQQQNFEWYFHGNLPACGINSKTENDQALRAVLSDCTSGHERFWLVIRGAPEVANRMRSFFLDPGNSAFHLIKKQELIEVSVYLFILAE